MLSVVDCMGEPNRWRPPGSAAVQGARAPMGRGPIVATIVKRDGHVEPFDPAKMIQSIQNAGATRPQASLVTNRVSARMMPGAPVPSNQVSTMVARSLSHVNPTASRNYADTRDRKLAYSNKVNRLSSEISIISQQVNGATVRIDSLNSRIQSLPGRIARIRKGNYRLLTHLETDQSTLSEEWARLSLGLKTTANLKGETVRTQIRDLQQALTYKAGASDYDLGNLQEIESGIPQLHLNLSEMLNSIGTELSPLEQKFANIDVDLRRAENTVSIVQGATFPWEDAETPILAIRAKDLNKETEGFITLTNLKFVFENEKEIVLKKTLFVVTEKKIVREVVVQKPIGMVTGLSQGRVGFFKGAGLFVKFASEAGIPEMKFDTTGEDAEWVTKSYNSIISGQVDQELVATAPAVEQEKEAPQLITCPVCGAPYTEKIYRGQTSVNCKYCGAVISLQ